jgi:DNA invertase Pin-like site-specific DNA recombinase
MPTAPRAALYARCSTTNRDVDLQLDELRAVAAHRSLVVVEEYVDEGVSGAATSRPGFDAMMKAAQGRKFEHLLVWKLDRLGRSTAHLVVTLDLLAGWGVSFTSVRDPGIDTASAHGRLLLQLRAVFASYERDIIRERVTAGVRRAQAAGRHVGHLRAAVPVDAAVALLGDGRGLREVAAMLKVNRNVLRDQLRESGTWPRVETPFSADVQGVG